MIRARTHGAAEESRITHGRADGNRKRRGPAAHLQGALHVKRARVSWRCQNVAQEPDHEGRADRWYSVGRSRLYRGDGSCPHHVILR